MSSMNYYAIREADKDSLSPPEIASLDVVYISEHYHFFTSRWVWRRIGRKYKHISHIKKWEYDMLDAFGIRKISMHTITEWGD